MVIMPVLYMCSLDGYHLYVLLWLQHGASALLDQSRIGNSVSLLGAGRWDAFKSKHHSYSAVFSTALGELTAYKMSYPTLTALSRVSGTSISKYHKDMAINITVVNAVKRTVIAKEKMPFLRFGAGLDTRVEADSVGGSILSSSSFQ